MREQVIQAEPYNPNNLGSLGNATHMLIRQYNFPDTYVRNKDQITGVDHDRLLVEDYNRYHQILAKHEVKDSISGWIRKAKPEVALAFIVEMLSGIVTKEEGWTGFRVLATTNRMNGQTVYTLELFKKHPDTTTKVYTGEEAPNVKASRRTGYVSIDQHLSEDGVLSVLGGRRRR